VLVAMNVRLSPAEVGHISRHSGAKLSTVEVEQALVGHPAVVDAAVIGIPDERWGERPKAFVVLAPGESVGERDLIEHVRSLIAHYKAPDAIEFVETLPRNSTGKLQKFELRQRHAAESRAAVS
jgi:fatty-acyl-CoA synthase